MSIQDALDWYDSLEDDLGYRIEKNKIDFAVLLNTLMLEQNINKAELAKRMKKSAPYITKVLGGDENVTIATMTKLLDAIDCELHLKGCRKDQDARWFVSIASSQTVGLSDSMKDASQLWARQVSGANEAA